MKIKGIGSVCIVAATVVACNILPLYVSAEPSNNQASSEAVVTNDNNVTFEAGGIGVGNVTVEAGNAGADSISFEAGAASVIENTPTEISRKEIESVDFWGYKNLGMAHVDNHLNVREAPNEDGKLVGKMSNNAACEILGIEDNWAKIKSGEVEGYACLDYLYTGIDAVKQAHEVVCPVAVVTADALNVRSEPNTDCSIVSTIPNGEILEFDALLDNGWVELNIDEDTVYVSQDYVSIEERLDTAITMTELLYGVGVSDVRIDLCQYAQKFIGNPYVWGGSSLTKGTDCSGFTMSVYKKYGITLPHHAASQAKMGTKVSLDNLKPGDLVFYGSKKSINHVAIYIGNGQVVHASSPKTGIKISKTNYRTPVCARSFLTD